MKQQLNPQQLSETLNARYAVKRFDATKKISAENWKALSESFHLCPSSYGLQPWKFIVVENPEIRAQLKGHSWNQTQITDASHLVVLTAKTKVDEAHIVKYVESTAKIRGIPAETLNGYRDMMIGDIVKGPRSQVAETWAQKQAYIAMGFTLLAAATLGIDACPMEGLDPAAYDKVLKLEGTGYKTVMVMTFGYRHAEDQFQNLKKSRFPESDVVVHVK